MPEGTACAPTRVDCCYCSQRDLRVGLDGLHGVQEHADARGSRLRVEVESPAREEGCRSCGAIARSHGRQTVRLIDTPCFGRPVELVWRHITSVNQTLGRPFYPAWPSVRPRPPVRVSGRTREDCQRRHRSCMGARTSTLARQRTSAAHFQFST